MSQRNTTLVGSDKRVSIDDNIFMHRAIKLSDSGRNLNIGTAMDKCVLFDFKIVDRARFKPAIGIVFTKNRRHSRAVKRIAFDEDWTTCREQNTARWNLSNLTISHQNQWRPCDIFHHIVFLDRFRDPFAESDELLVRVEDFDVGDFG